MNNSLITALFLLLSISLTGNAKNPTEDFHSNFNDSTLRIDYVFAGSKGKAGIYLHQQSKQPGWAGRKSRLKETPRKGNATIVVTSPISGDTLYANSFSSLFQEWLTTPEAVTSSRSFENSFMVPLPKHDADITVSLRDNHHKEITRHTHRYRHNDELVRLSGLNPMDWEYVHKGDSSGEAIDVAMVAEGYRTDEMDKFVADSKRIAEEILSYEPFSSNKNKFNFIAVKTPSENNGVNIPLKNIWINNIFGSHFSTFYSPRYLTTPKIWKVHEMLEGIPYEHVIVIANTDQYGGGGIYNSYQIAPSDNEYTLPVSVHEFGHSFAGLADEYFYVDEPEEIYPINIEPWEGNITTLIDFNSKWADMMDSATPIPTPWSTDDISDTAKMTDAENQIGVYEGAGYKPNGVYRPVLTCRMRDNHYPSFCPVCQRVISEVIKFYTE